jgi:hypothetical protein
MGGDDISTNFININFNNIGTNDVSTNLEPVDVSTSDDTAVFAGAVDTVDAAAVDNVVSGSTNALEVADTAALEVVGTAGAGTILEPVVSDATSTNINIAPGEEDEMDQDACSAGHDDRAGTTSQERCLNGNNCIYIESTDHCCTPGTECCTDIKSQYDTLVADGECSCQEGDCAELKIVYKNNCNCPTN